MSSRIFWKGFGVGAYTISLLGDIYYGFHFKGFLVGTLTLYFYLLIIERVLKEK